MGSVCSALEDSNVQQTLSIHFNSLWAGSSVFLYLYHYSPSIHQCRTPSPCPPAASGFQTMDVPIHWLSFLPTHLSPTPACSLFLSFPLCSPSLTAGLVFRVLRVVPPVPCFSFHFCTDFHLVYLLSLSIAPMIKD